jgi:hypothetical protein
VYNTLGSISWVRSSVGNYIGTAPVNTFTYPKTFFPNKQFCRYIDSSGARNIYTGATGSSGILVRYTDENGNYVDGANFQFEIREYY